MRAANLALRFLLEVSALVALGYWGFHAGSSEALHWILGIGTPLVAAVVWGLFVAPRRRFDVPFAVWVLLQAIVFGAAIVGLLASGLTTIAIVFAVLLAINATLMVVWGQRGDAGDLVAGDP
ncbi:MAG TPA: YrdB family protein [Actinomycetota bacterium]|nr:YrdB family protein [Actinomycetota bacterium]